MSGNTGGSVTVKFKAEYRSDGGFRVYATEPTGLYVSSESTYAAAEYFQNMMPVLVADPNRPEDSVISLESEIDWRKFAANGGGECIFKYQSRAEVEAELGPIPDPETGPDTGDFPRNIEGESPLAEIELKIDSRRIGNKGIFVVTDHGETDPVLEEVIARQERAQ